MKSISSILFILFLTASLSAQDETRELDSYDEIRVSTGITVNLMKGEPRAEITIKKGDIDDLKTEVKNGKLVVKFHSKNSWFGGSGNRSASIDLYYDGQLESISASGGARLKCNETLNSDDMHVNSSGGGSLKLSLDSNTLDANASGGGRMELNVSTKKIDANASGGGSIRVEGTTNTLAINSSGGGSFRGGDLKSKNVSANASGGGSASVWAEASLEATASGGGSVKYKGNPEKKDINVGKYSGGSISKF